MFPKFWCFIKIKGEFFGANFSGRIFLTPKHQRQPKKRNFNFLSRHHHLRVFFMHCIKIRMSKICPTVTTVLYLVEVCLRSPQKQIVDLWILNKTWERNAGHFLYDSRCNLDTNYCAKNSSECHKTMILSRYPNSLWVWTFFMNFEGLKISKNEKIELKFQFLQKRFV